FLLLCLSLQCCGAPRDLHSFPTRRSSDLAFHSGINKTLPDLRQLVQLRAEQVDALAAGELSVKTEVAGDFTDNNQLIRRDFATRSEEHTSELQSRENLVCRLLLEKKKKKT